MVFKAARILVYFLSAAYVPRAIALPIDPSLATANAIAPNATIDADLKAKSWSVHPTFGYFSGSANVDGTGATATAAGYGETLNAQYSVSDHFGLSLSAMNYSGSGSYTPSASSSGGSSGADTVKGWLAGVSLVLDPFRGSGFRMPFFLGLNYEQLSSTTPSSPLITSLSLSSPGYSVGFSPRFNIGFLRIEPFFVVSTPTSKGNVSCSALVVAGACGAQDIQALPVYGVNLVFRPLNFSFYINLSSLLLGTGISFYSFGAQLTF